MQTRILLSVPHMSGREELYVREAFASNWLSSVGPNLTAFEKEFEAYIGLPCAALASGTAAIHLGLRLLGVGSGDTVFCSTLTFAASANPVRYLGADPVFIDSDYSTWNMDPQLLEEALRDAVNAGRLPKAVVVVDLYGQCADMEPIRAMCARYGVPILEDAAESLGATYRGQQAGTFGDVAAFSFNGNKIITTTGGGMLVSPDRAWIEKARFWSQQARDPGLAYQHSEIGFNYGMSNVLAGIGRGQLQVLEQRVAARRAIAFRYRDALADVPGISLMPQAGYGLHTNWLSCFLIDEEVFGLTRDQLIAALDKANVESRPLWKPMHLQPLFAGCGRIGGEVAEDLFRRGICLPSSSSLTAEDQTRIIRAIRAAVGARAIPNQLDRPESDSLLGCSQIASNMVLDTNHRARQEQRVLIYGAGDAGAMLLREILTNPGLAYDVCGFLDDDPGKKGLCVDGVAVLGCGEDAQHLVRDHQIDLILIAVPSAKGTEMTRIVELCHAAGVPCKTLPRLAAIDVAMGLARQIRDVALEDLLERIPVHLEEQQIRSTIERKTVLITGAAGSIGSELCRQIARFHPAAIVGFEIAESPLFEIDREMRRAFPTIPFYAEIGSVQSRERLDEVFSQYRPTVVYHAAAYKHVPLMEANVFEAVENNVFGTYNLVKAAAFHGVESLVMISTDKAVHPTSAMGATKRAAELLLLNMQHERTQFIAVRFGNVLGSSGSVIPIFRDQIASGGPVTVTDPEMRRFFMTIPEAAQLVLQAAATCEGGQICVLDMGQPVSIVELARKLILMAGLEPGKDIVIEFTGIRPGEKLHEEMYSLFEKSLPTSHERIRILVGNGSPDINAEEWLGIVYDICRARDVGRLVIALKEMVRDYNPSAELLNRMSQRETVDTALMSE